MDEIINDLLLQFSQMNTQEERVERLEQIATGYYAPLEHYKMTRNQSRSRRSTLSTEARNEEEDRKFMQALCEMCSEYDLEESLMKIMFERSTSGILHDEHPWSGPLLFLPCANVDLRSQKKCSNPGIHACTACRLVSYCSTACQSAHWRNHKKDCKSELNSTDWMPNWIMENRDPSFVGPASSPLEDGSNRTSVDQRDNLWGNVPGINILNLERNEGLAYKQDLSLCFAASGDLRDVILSINDIPADYPGHVSIIINDRNPRIVARNLLILLAIAGAKNTNIAADLALHLWYSAFIPAGHNDRMMATIVNSMASMKEYHMDWQSGKLRIISDLSAAVGVHFMGYMKYYERQEPLDPKAMAKAYSKVTLSAGRVDYRDSYISRLKPAHRVALTKYKWNGLVLPFGAVTSSFDTPNITLFTNKGEWLQSDLASPLASWEMSSVIATGKARGAKEEDLLGCLYFYLSEQLIKFKQQLSKLHVTFYLGNMDSPDLSKAITSNGPLANTINSLPYPPELPSKFDRIHVANTVEQRYLGYGRVLADWAPLLNDSNPMATLLSYSKYWASDHPYEEDEEVAGNNMYKFLSERGRLIPRLNEKKFPHVIRPEVYSVASFAWHRASDSMYDNSANFEEYLEKQGIKERMESLGIQMKSQHTITPKRHCIPLSAPLCTVPSYNDDNHWYLEVLLSHQSFRTRFQEFSRSDRENSASRNPSIIA